MLAVALLAMVSMSMLPMISELSRTSDSAKIYTKLGIITDYVGQYLFRWAALSSDKKPLPFSYYLSSEGKEFDITGDKRVNSMAWAQPLMSQNNFMSDEYKVSITFWETATRTKSAVVKVIVWYDENLDGILDATERRMSFSTMLTELQPI